MTFQMKKMTSMKCKAKSFLKDAYPFFKSNFPSRRGGAATKVNNPPPKQKSAFDYGDLEISEDEGNQKNEKLRNSSLNKNNKLEESLGNSMA